MKRAALDHALMAIGILSLTSIGCRPDDQTSQILSESADEYRYHLSNEQPRLSHDYGSGVWDSIDWTYQAVGEKEAVASVAAPAFAALVGWDAAAHMTHYINNTGKDYTIRLDHLIDDCFDARNNYRAELVHAMKFSEALPSGSYRMMSKETQNGYCYKYDSKNWFYASGGYTLWGAGKLNKQCNANDVCSYALTFTFHFFDRYNWDGGKSVEIRGRKITDEALGQWHRMGIAREFNMFGSLTHTFRWKSDDGAAKNAVFQQLDVMKLDAEDIERRNAADRGAAFHYYGPSFDYENDKESTLDRESYPQNAHLPAPAAKPAFIMNSGPDLGTFKKYKTTDESDPSVFGKPSNPDQKERAKDI